MKKLLLIYLAILNFGLSAMEIDADTELTTSVNHQVKVKKQKTKEVKEAKTLFEIEQPESIQKMAALQVIKNILQPDFKVNQIKNTFESLPLELKDYIQLIINEPRGPVNNTMLHEATTPEAVNKLLALGANPMAIRLDDEKPFTTMVKNGYSRAAYELLKHIPNINEYEFLLIQDTIIYVVLSQNAVALLKLLKEKGIKNRQTHLDAASDIGFKLGNAVLIALKNEKYALLPYLLKLGYNLDTISSETRKSALTIAIVQNAPIETINLLICQRQISAKDNFGKTALMYAAEQNDLEITKLLIEKSANINDTDNRGFTPLMYALSRDASETAKFLLQNGADVNIKDNDGTTTLIKAVLKISNNISQIIRLLLDKGAIIHDETTPNQETCLICAAVLNPNPKEALSAIIRHGADINARDEEGRTALIWAVSSSKPKEAMIELIRHGADVNIKDNDGKSANDYYLEKLKNTF